jgi:N-acetylglucosaminyldiphosphoundecaprenol N-acetyl-beta-D-mannosaminyltransferase
LGEAVRVEFIGLPIDILSSRETVDLAVAAMRSRKRLQHVAINVAKIVKARSDAELRRDIVGSDLVGIDGMGVVLGLRLAGYDVPERVAGVDVMVAILMRCAKDGFSPFFFGATKSVVEAAAEAACRQFPGLKMAGIENGYFTLEEEPAIIDRIRESRADCLFIGLPTPRKERLLAKYRDSLGIPFIMGVGGSFDVLAGQVRRAPLWVRRWGLEWAYRVYQEPGRLWWRYASTNLAYAGLMVGVLFRRLTTGRP